MDFTKPVQTRDGRPVEILKIGLQNRNVYAVGTYLDNKGEEHVDLWDIHGQLLPHTGQKLNVDLVQAPVVSPSDIPWRCLRPEIKWVAMDITGTWFGYDIEPNKLNTIWSTSSKIYALEGVNMPKVPQLQWSETLVQRPGGETTNND